MRVRKEIKFKRDKPQLGSGWHYNGGGGRGIRGAREGASRQKHSLTKGSVIRSPVTKPRKRK